VFEKQICLLLHVKEYATKLYPFEIFLLENEYLRFFVQWYDIVVAPVIAIGTFSISITPLSHLYCIRMWLKSLDDTLHEGIVFMQPF